MQGCLMYVIDHHEIPGLYTLPNVVFFLRESLLQSTSDIRVQLISMKLRRPSSDNAPQFFEKSCT